MKLSFYVVFWSAFVEAGVASQSLSIILCNLGGLGIPQGSLMTPPEMEEVRRAEFVAAMQRLGFGYEILGFKDTELRTHFEELVFELSRLIRAHGFDVVMSFHPLEMTKLIDHPDHTVAGLATREAATYSDVGHKYPELPALQKRPELWFWTTNKYLATHSVSFSKKVERTWLKYLLTQYPSQFSPKGEKLFEKQVFEKIFKRPGKHKKKQQFRSYLVRVR